MKQFYVTLISNSSLDIYPGNKPSSFVVQLPHKIVLNEDWVVGLAEIQYPYNFYNVTENNNSFTCDFETNSVYSFTNGKYSTVRNIIVGSYRSVGELVKAILYQTPDLGDWIEFDNSTNRVRIKVTNEIKSSHPLSQNFESDDINQMRSIQFHGRLALQLGFIPDTNVLTHEFSPYGGNVCFGVPDRIFVYCDLIEPQLIGYESTQVIKIINSTERESEFGTSCYREFQKIHYVPLLKKVFDRVEIDLRDITGEYFPFRHGISSVKLHFKRTE